MPRRAIYKMNRCSVSCVLYQKPKFQSPFFALIIL